MTIAYKVGRGLYVNMTNRCRNDCQFCIRNLCDSVGDAGSLWLEREPSREEVLEDIKKHDLTGFDEIVFCGFGEPTERLDDMLWVCKHLKDICTLPIRINTNGHADLIAGYDTASKFSGLVDVLSISLNAPSAKEYNTLCKPVFGLKTYQSILDFAKNAKKYVPEVILSVVGGTTDIEACGLIAKEMGLKFRVR